MRNSWQRSLFDVHWSALFHLTEQAAGLCAEVAGCACCTANVIANWMCQKTKSWYQIERRVILAPPRNLLMVEHAASWRQAMVACLPAIDTANQMPSSSGKAALECEKCARTVSSAGNFIMSGFFFSFSGKTAGRKAHACNHNYRVSYRHVFLIQKMFHCF